MPGDSDSSRFGWMLELPMASALRHLIPTIIQDETEHVPNFHLYGSSLSQR